MEEFKTGFLKYFYEISKIPRKSGNEEKIAKYLIEFAKERNLKYYTDSKFNVIIWKDASIGYEDKEILGFQCHTDMVCEKVDGSNHDFLKDSLDLIIENGFLKAKDTTLGADNGIGVAYILEILDSNLNTPALECIFTSTEETTMEGVRFLDGNILKSKRIISFDNFLDTEILISSATAKRWVSKIYMKRQEKDGNLIYYKLDISGFKGGHSGIDIWDKKRGNPIKIVVDNLNELESIRVVEISGGSSENVIPRDINVVFAIEESEKDILERLELLIRPLTRELKYFFDGHTTLAKNSDFMVFNIKELINGDSNVRNALFFNVLKYAWGLCLDPSINTVLMVDEAHVLLGDKNEMGADFLAQVQRRARKYNTGTIVITQQPSDFADPAVIVQGKAIFDNASYYLVMGLKKQATEDLARLIDLNDNEIDSIKGYSQGEALFVCGNRRMRINIAVTKEELDSFGTGGGY